MDRLCKLLAEVETDEDPDFYNADNGPENALEEIFSDPESFCELDTESHCSRSGLYNRTPYVQRILYCFGGSIKPAIHFADKLEIFEREKEKVIKIHGNLSNGLWWLGFRLDLNRSENAGV
ncbi:hypothetical protein AVEN_142998-1 [Araneus ventricosus]|uniref:Uncharacterized protein n=1 Tax=Araneus ventricosus TaxID=182803 RepID=A0A4Y2JV58_ARAVE|nr:hypothetical protein AVEN_142998-1 [Araneus ventricosus]